jgi:hypothetical protein
MRSLRRWHRDGQKNLVLREKKKISLAILILNECKIVSVLGLGMIKIYSSKELCSTPHAKKSGYSRRLFLFRNL